MYAAPLPRRLSTIVGLAFAALSMPIGAQPAFDVVGVRPGMTEAAALAALTAHRSGMRVNKRTMSYNYSDGARQHTTPAFLYELFIVYDDATGAREDFRLYFSPPPGESRLVGVTRQVKLPAPPTQAQLAAQLSQKYGPPVVTGKNYADANLAWGEPGKPMCWRSSPKATAIGAGDGAEIVPHLLNGQAKGWAPKDLSQCGVAAAATLAGDPVHGLVVRVTDYGAWATSQMQAKQWVEGLRREAVKARLASGSGPKL